jgi:hypothetical protein
LRWGYSAVWTYEVPGICPLWIDGKRVDRWARQSPNRGATVGAIAMAVVWFLVELLFYRHRGLWQDVAVALVVGVLAGAFGLVYVLGSSAEGETGPALGDTLADRPVRNFG